MKGKILFSCLLIILATACQEDPIEDNSSKDAYTISWQVEDYVGYGTIYLSENNEARIVVDNPDEVIFSEQHNVPFNWSANDETFTLTRQDNGFSMDYKIEEKGVDSYSLSLADKLLVNIYR